MFFQSSNLDDVYSIMLQEIVNSDKQFFNLSLSIQL